MDNIAPIAPIEGESLCKKSNILSNNIYNNTPNIGRYYTSGAWEHREQTENQEKSSSPKNEEENNNTNNKNLNPDNESWEVVPL